MTALRAYQLEARDAVHTAWRDHRAVLLVLATGTGKTYTSGEILRTRANDGRILWLAHRTELLEQATETLQQRIQLGCELEKADSRASQLGGLFGNPVVVASVQTLRGARLERWRSDSFATIVVDEAHHAAARGYREILSRFSDAKVLGLTATPDRGDGVGLGAVFDVVAYQYDLRAAIKDGYLKPIVQKAIHCGAINIADVKTVAGDLAQGELEKRLKLDAVLHQIAAPLVKESGSRPTLVFTAGVAQAHALVDVLTGYLRDGVRACALDGSTPAEFRAERIDDFRRGRIQYLVNCGLFLEGTDLPTCSCVAMARPTKSRPLYAQALGRATRPLPGVIDARESADERVAAIAASAAPDCLVLDFVGNAGKHRLVTPLDVLAGRPLPSDVEARARKLAASGKPSEEALAQAEAEAIDRARETEERRRRETKIRADVQYRSQQVDPFGIVSGERGPRATDAQLGALQRGGVELGGHVPSIREASKLLDTLKKRRQQGLCTYRQARVLAKHGLPIDLSFADARDAIDALAAARWRCPPWLLAKYAKAEPAAEAAE